MRVYRGVDPSAFRDLPKSAQDALLEMHRTLQEVTQELSRNRAGSAATAASAAIIADAALGTDNVLIKSDGTARSAQATGIVVTDANSVSGVADLTLSGALDHDGTTAGFYGIPPVAQQNLTGTRSGGTALTNLITLLETLGVLTDSTT